ncbi:MAG: beta-galactosidase trimerization domain-containing protein, partial [Promicromonosporaceae bacterium]|nr:beta-galactosidase trimerization domain-containing protein [Promicromonosporaceae bacterium]
PFSGIVDEHDTVHAGGFMAPLKEALGVWVEEFLPLRKGESVRLSLHDDGAGAATRSLEGTVWADHLRVTTADTVAKYVDGPMPGGPAITRNRLGDGVGWYLSTVLEGSDLNQVLQLILSDASSSLGEVETLPEEPGLELLVRKGDHATYLIAINHGEQDARFAPQQHGVTGQGVEMLSGDQVTAKAATVPAAGVAVYRFARK